MIARTIEELESLSGVSHKEAKSMVRAGMFVEDNKIMQNVKVAGGKCLTCGAEIPEWNFDAPLCAIPFTFAMPKDECTDCRKKREATEPREGDCSEIGVSMTCKACGVMLEETGRTIETSTWECPECGKGVFCGHGGEIMRVWGGEPYEEEDDD